MSIWAAFILLLVIAGFYGLMSVYMIVHLISRLFFSQK